MFRIAIALILAAVLSGCGVVYISPGVQEGVTQGAKVRVIDITPSTLRAANASPYRPPTLPAIFAQTAGVGSRGGGTGPLPEPSSGAQNPAPQLALRVPPTPPNTPYRIGVDDVVVLATRAPGSTAEELSGLLAVQNRRQEYTVQDDGSISIPDVGRVEISGMTLDEAEEAIFNALVANQIDPTFSLEVARFNSRRVSIGGKVGAPGVVTIGLSPLYLDEALSAAGGVTAEDIDFATIRLYRDGTLYQIPLMELYSNRSLQRIPLTAGDALFVDSDYRLDRAETYFREQIQLSTARQDERSLQLAELDSEIDRRRAQLNESRNNFRDRIEFDAVDRDYVYLTGEVFEQRRFVMPFEQTVSLADALFNDGGAPTITGNPSELYVLRGSSDPRDLGSVTAWKLNARNAALFTMATQFQLRPNDVVFVAEQPITKWNRVITQITPGLIQSSAVVVASAN